MKILGHNPLRWCTWAMLGVVALCVADIIASIDLGQDIDPMAIMLLVLCGLLATWFSRVASQDEKE